MPRTCTICNHNRIADINDALIHNGSYRSIAKRFGASGSAIYRHQQEHLPKALSKAKEAAAEIDAGTLFERLRELNHQTQAILREARLSGKHAIALQAIGRAEKQLELEARLLGELDESVKVAVGVNIGSPKEEELVGVLANVLSPAELEDIQARILAFKARRLNSTTDVVAEHYNPSQGGADES